MSTVYLTLLLLAVLAAGAMGAAVLLALSTLRREVAALHLDALRAAVPAARAPGRSAAAGMSGDVDASLRRRSEIREAVADALAEERERELAEARAFWAAQEAREAADAPLLETEQEDGGPEGPASVSRQADMAGFEDFRGFPMSAEGRSDLDQQFTEALREAIDELVRDAEAGTGEEIGTAEEPEGASEGAAGPGTGTADAEYVADPGGGARPIVPDMRRHPSHPAFRPVPAVADQTRISDRLEALAGTGIPLSDVRPGPLGTLDVYIFDDGTTLCVTPGDRAATARLTEALRSGESPLLMGGSGLGGGYALTFGVGEDTVYVLADRVVASL